MLHQKRQHPLISLLALVAGASEVGAVLVKQSRPELSCVLEDSCGALVVGKTPAALNPASGGAARTKRPSAATSVKGNSVWSFTAVRGAAGGVHSPCRLMGGLAVSQPAGLTNLVK